MKSIGRPPLKNKNKKGASLYVYVHFKLLRDDTVEWNNPVEKQQTFSFIYMLVYEQKTFWDFHFLCCTCLYYSNLL